jgi:hypothetical protein
MLWVESKKKRDVDAPALSSVVVVSFFEINVLVMHHDFLLVLGKMCRTECVVVVLHDDDGRDVVAIFPI